MTTEEIQELIAQNQLKKAIQALTDYVKGLEKESPLENDLILQSARLHSNAHKKDQGIISQEQASIEESRIRSTLLNLLGRVTPKNKIRAEGDGNVSLQNTQNSKITINKVSGSGANDKQERNQATQKILYLYANPENTNPLSFAKENRAITHYLAQEASFNLLPAVTSLRRSEFLDWVEVAYEQDIAYLHLSSHGSATSGLLLENEHGYVDHLSVQDFKRIFQLLSQEHPGQKLPFVMLSACHSLAFAEAIASEYVQFAVGMNQAIPVIEAISFTEEFYRQIARGKDIQAAFDRACFQARTEIPRLVTG